MRKERKRTRTSSTFLDSFFFLFLSLFVWCNFSSSHFFTSYPRPPHTRQPQESFHPLIHIIFSSSSPFLFADSQTNLLSPHLQHNFSVVVSVFFMLLLTFTLLVLFWSLFHLPPHITHLPSKAVWTFLSSQLCMLKSYCVRWLHDLRSETFLSSSSLSSQTQLSHPLIYARRRSKGETRRESLN